MSASGDTPTAKRAYNADSRRERADLERRETRQRVLAAARARFLADGYAGTKMSDIAQEAGVAIASVYRAGSSKSDLIQTLTAMAITGRDPQESAEESAQRLGAVAALGPPTYPQIAATPDPARQVEMMADLIAEVLERIGPLWGVLRDAASVDAGAAEAFDTASERRGLSFGVALALLPEDRLRGGIDECTDTLWALSDPEVYLMLRNSRGWSQRRYRDWLVRTLVLQLLTSE